MDCAADVFHFEEMEIIEKQTQELQNETDRPDSTIVSSQKKQQES